MPGLQSVSVQPTALARILAQQVYYELFEWCVVQLNEAQKGTLGNSQDDADRETTGSGRRGAETDPGTWNDQFLCRRFLFQVPFLRLDITCRLLTVLQTHSLHFKQPSPS